MSPPPPRIERPPLNLPGATPASGTDIALAARFEVHRKQYENLESAELFGRLNLDKTSPKLSFDPTTAKYFSEVQAGLKMTRQETRTFRETGVVNLDLRQPFSMGGAYYTIWARDLPVLVTTDSILHALHRSYGKVLKDLETELFTLHIDRILTELGAELGHVALGKDHEALGPSLSDVDLYVTVARNLLAGAGVPGDPLGPGAQGKLQRSSIVGQDDTVAEMLVRISSLKLEDVRDPASCTRVYGGRRAVDYSQFQPRGHYTESVALERYFRAMMWLGRTDLAFLLTPPDRQSNWVIDVEREQRSALLLALLVGKGREVDRLRSMSRMIDFLVGRADSLTLDSVLGALRADGLTEPAQLTDKGRVEMVAGSLAVEQASAKQIRSAALGSSVGTVRPTALPVVFQLFGQRFALDSFVLSKVVFDSIIHEETKVQRMMPSGLDVMAALGNGEAVKALTPELAKYHYSANLLAARSVVEEYAATGAFESSAYGIWIDALRSLDDQPSSPGFPELMRSATWQKKQLQTQLASWAELRHDTLLYATQSYTGVPLCKYPDAYVEPYPEFFARLVTFGKEMAKRLKALDVSAADRPIELKRQQLRDAQVAYFDGFADIVGRLRLLAEKELRAEAFTPEETTFLEDTIQISSGGSGPPRYDGWYPKLIYSGAPDKFEPTVADVHTDPASQSVLEVAVGGANFIVAALDNKGDRAVYVGPVYSYYEFTHPAADRLQDRKWQYWVSSQKLPPRPAWTRDFVVPATTRTLSEPPPRRKANASEGGQR